MAGYSGMILTNAGLQLQAQAQLGGELRITKMAVGDGILAAGENYEDLTALKNQKMTLGIQDMEVIGNGQSRIRALITNDNLNTGFFVREVGVFAKIGDNGAEKLYSYTNASDKADYLPSKGINVVEEVLEVYIIVGNAQNVTCLIDDRVTLATKQDLTEHTSNTNNPHNTVASQVTNTLISGLNTTDVQSTLEAIFSESKKKSGTVRNTVITGPVSAGMANVLRDRYSENLCTGGTAISSGNGATPTISIADYAFDGNRVTSGWESSQKRNACNGLAWIGYTFSVAKTIKKVLLYQNDTGGGVTSVKVQYGADGVTWNDALTATVLATADLRITGTYSAKYWRILANSNGIDNSSVNGWGVREVEMYELLNPELTDSDILIEPNALVAFAAGFDLVNKQPVDYWELTQQMSLTLDAADGYTVPLSYTTDLCNGGTAISGGDLANYPASNAFDNSANIWYSQQVHGAISGAAWIGYNFGAPKAIRKAYLEQNGVVNEGHNITSVKVQFSDNGTAWTTATTQSIKESGNMIGIPAVGSHQYWRFLANSDNGTAGYSWDVFEAEFYEALQTHYVYLTRDVNGFVTVGSTRNKPRTVKPISTTITTAQGHYTADLCSGGTPISGGDSANGINNAFDNNGSTFWISSQTGSGVVGVAYAGYDFGSAKIIRKMQLSLPAISYIADSVRIQGSNGAQWNDVLTISGLSAGGGGGLYPVLIPPNSGYRYWRILANSSTATGYGFALHELEMMEYVEPTTSSVQADDTTYSDNLCTGGAASASSIFSTYYPQNAFDGNSNTWWESNNAGGSGDSISYDFGVARHIRRLTLDQSSVDGTTFHYMSSVKVQRCSDGVNWVDVYTANGLSGGKNIINLPANTPSRFWRVVANAQTSGGVSFLWCVSEITMNEISNDINLYDPISGVSKHYDGNTWDTINRVFIGEAVTDSVGNVVSYTTYPYNKTKLKALPAEDTDDVVTLGQLISRESTSGNGWIKFSDGTMIQKASATLVSNVTVQAIYKYAVGSFTFPLAFASTAYSTQFIHGGHIPMFFTEYNTDNSKTTSQVKCTAVGVEINSSGVGSFRTDIPWTIVCTAIGRWKE